jgi:hypothetical protein
MKMKVQKYILTISISLLALISCKESNLGFLRNNITKNSILVLNDNYVLLEPISFLDKINEKSIIKTGTIPVDKIEYQNKIESIVSIKMDSTVQSVIDKSKWIDFQFLSKVNPKNNSLYMIDGFPMYVYDSVFNYLINRNVIEINFIGSTSAIAIWGTREGQNGAIQINTKKRKNETIIPIIIK